MEAPTGRSIVAPRSAWGLREAGNVEPCRGDLMVGWFRCDGVRVRLDRTFSALVGWGWEPRATLVPRFAAGLRWFAPLGRGSLGCIVFIMQMHLEVNLRLIESFLSFFLTMRRGAPLEIGSRTVRKKFFSYLPLDQNRGVLLELLNQL